MAQKYDGSFTSNFFSIQLQLKTMLEEAGGEAAGELLDSLSQLSGSEQKVVLGIFNRIISRIVAGEQRLVTEGDLARKAFEDNLYEDLLQAINSAAAEDGAGSKRLELVSGGKTPAAARTSAPIDLAKARRDRAPKVRNLFN